MSQFSLQVLLTSRWHLPCLWQLSTAICLSRILLVSLILWSPDQCQILPFPTLTFRRQLTQAFQISQSPSQQCIPYCLTRGSVCGPSWVIVSWRVFRSLTQYILPTIPTFLRLLILSTLCQGSSSSSTSFNGCNYTVQALRNHPSSVLEPPPGVLPGQNTLSYVKVLCELFTRVVFLYRHEDWYQGTWGFMCG